MRRQRKGYTAYLSLFAARRAAATATGVCTTIFGTIAGVRMIDSTLTVMVMNSGVSFTLSSSNRLAHKLLQGATLEAAVVQEIPPRTFHHPVVLNEIEFGR